MFGGVFGVSPIGFQLVSCCSEKLVPYVPCPYFEIDIVRLIGHPSLGHKCLLAEVDPSPALDRNTACVAIHCAGGPGSKIPLRGGSRPESMGRDHAGASLYVRFHVSTSFRSGRRSAFQRLPDESADLGRVQSPALSRMNWS